MKEVHFLRVVLLFERLRHFSINLGELITVDNHVPRSKFNTRLNHILLRLLLSRKVHPHRIAFNKKIAEVGLTHEP
jgi:hypothetical protein